VPKRKFMGRVKGWMCLEW